MLKFNGLLVSKLQSLVIWSLWVVAHPASARVNVYVIRLDTHIQQLTLI
jgi:hypothetical protein